MSDTLTAQFGGQIIEADTLDGIGWCLAWGPFSINGYVVLPDGHPWRDVEDYNDIDAEVHGGITYFEDGVIGFDTSHLGDAYHPLAPQTAGIPPGLMPLGIVRDQQYVRTETLSLAKQVRKAQV